MTSTRLCLYEGGEPYPAAQFRLDPTYGWVHEVDPLHTVDGDIVPIGAAREGGFDHAMPEDDGALPEESDG